MLGKYLQRTLLVLMVLLLLSCGIQSSPVQAQEGIQFSDPEVSNEFPDRLTIRMTATSPDQQIVSAEFAYSRATFYSPESYTIETVELTPGSQVVLEYTLETDDVTTPPMMSYLYRWELVLEDGTDYISQTFSLPYMDIRYNWQVLENDLAAVWWHDKPAEFGQAVFEIATEAIRLQQELYKLEPENQLKIVINNNREEFASWHSIAYDWVGGETFTDYGITIQIIESNNPEDAWLYGVIPHEISHIFFDQATYNPKVVVPVWLNEGVAQYNELISQDWVLQRVKDAAESDELIPLHKLARGFGAHNTERIYLSYAEALSAVIYLVDTYGAEGLASLLAAYRDGNPTEGAFPAALGLSAGQFELDWAASLGVDDYQLSTPPPLPTFRPSPTPGSGNYTGATPTRDPVQSPPSSPLPVCSSVISLLVVGLIAFRQKTIP